MWGTRIVVRSLFALQCSNCNKRGAIAESSKKSGLFWILASVGEALTREISCQGCDGKTFLWGSHSVTDRRAKNVPKESMTPPPSRIRSPTHFIVLRRHQHQYTLLNSFFVKSTVIMLASSSRVLLRTATGICGRTALQALVARSAVGQSNSSALLGGSSSTKVKSVTFFFYCALRPIIHST